MKSRPKQSEVVYDWNALDAPPALQGRRFALLDETLRDGCQSPSVKEPRLEDKLRLLHLMDGLGVARLDIGLPGAGPRARADMAVLLKEIGRKKLRIDAMVACRTVVDPDLTGAAELSQHAGVPLSVYAFIGSSPIRQWAEDWPLAFIVKQT